MLSLFLSAALLSTLLTGLAAGYARRRGMLDHPGERSSHSLPTPRGGGAGWVAAFLAVAVAYLYLTGAAATWLGFLLLGGAVIMAALGWLDDHLDLDARIRAAVQLLASVIAVAAFMSADLLGGWLMPLLVILFLSWMTNLYNFMDGSNGMAGFQGLFVSTVLAVLFIGKGDGTGWAAALVLAGCCFGFLPWNLGRARVFMGDVGSLPLGFLIACLLVYGAATSAFAIPVALMVTALFLVDATLTLSVRVMRGERWYNAHRQHLYQRLISLGWTHGRVLTLYMAINLLLVLPGVVFGVNFPDMAWATAAALGLLLGSGWYLSIRKIENIAEAK